jgi:hypothetical protein
VFDLLFSLTFLSTVGIVGSPLARLLPAEVFRWRMMAAPVFGLGAVGILIASAYRHDRSLYGAALVSVIAACVIAAWHVAMFVRRPAAQRSIGMPLLLALGTALAILLLCLAPKWTGGARYSIFRARRPLNCGASRRRAQPR